MTKHYMCDLETAGTSPTSAIVAIGLVEFKETEIVRQFYTNVSLKSCVDAGMTMDPDTVMWWIEQSSQARAALMKNPAHVNVALNMAAEFMLQDVLQANVRMWGNGAAFDNVILANAYKMANLPAPWRFYNDRCFRTMKTQFELLPNEMPERGGTHHNALDDAIFQVQHLQAICKKYGIHLS